MRTFCHTRARSAKFARNALSNRNYFVRGLETLYNYARSAYCSTPAKTFAIPVRLILTYRTLLIVPRTGTSTVREQYYVVVHVSVRRYGSNRVCVPGTVHECTSQVWYLYRYRNSTPVRLLPVGPTYFYVLVLVLK